MAIKNLDYRKVDSPFQVKRIDKGEIKYTPLNEAFGNAKSVVAPRLKSEPLPTNATVPAGE